MIIPIILAGGSGTRLWPLSNKKLPKQFAKLLGDESMLQMTLNRLYGIPDLLPPIIITNVNYQDLVEEQLTAIKDKQIILEPIGKNTAPAIAIAAMHACILQNQKSKIINIDQSKRCKILENAEDPILLVIPADSAIADIKAYQQAIINAVTFAKNGKLVCFGVIPNRPETGYGYIKFDNDYKIQQFVEKPNLELAKKYLSEGNYYWNSGMFMFHAKLYLAELAQFAPDIFANCAEVIANSDYQNNLLQLSADDFAACRSDSIDYAVMEKTKNGFVVPLDAGWSDIGSWQGLWEYKISNQNLISDNNDINTNSKNIIVGNAFTHDVTNSYICASNRKVVVIGIDNCAIVETEDAVLVMNKNCKLDLNKIESKS